MFSSDASDARFEAYVEGLVGVIASADRAEHQPIRAKALATSLPAAAWETITWHEGPADRLVSRYARIRIRAAHRDYDLPEPRAEEWVLIEWPEGEAEPMVPIKPSTYAEKRDSLSLLSG
jgi:hypothetical protein